MEVAVNWLGVVVATLSTMVVGSIWYMPKVFGNTWMELIGKKRKDLEKNGMWPILITLVVSFITAYVLAHIMFLSHEVLKGSWIQTGLSTAFWAWLGFTAARFITHDSFEGRPVKLTLLNLSHELLTFLVMGGILGWLHP